jgi:STE24 endopeptidase
MHLSNPYFTLILCTVLLAFVLETISSLLNVKALQPQPPAELAGIYDAEKYAKSQQHTREGTRSDLIADSIKLLVFLGFWLLGGFAWWEQLSRSFGYGSIVTGLIFIGGLAVASSLVSLPFELYDTFVLEAKYGFNKTTLSTFITDRIKGAVLGSLIGGGILSLVLWIFEKLPNAWLYAWGAVTVITLAMTYIGPKWIMPLFNKFTPLADGELKQSIAAVAKRCDFPFAEISVMDGSKRSNRGNAFFAGFGKTKIIALFDTLIEKHTVPELTAVLAHEIGHFKRKHIVQRLVVGIWQIGLLFFLLGLMLNNEKLSAAFGIATPTVAVSLVLFTFLYEPVQFLFGVFSSIWSRKHEYEADAYAADAMDGPETLMSGLKKLSADNLTNLTPHPVHVFLHYSHPPLSQRLAALAAWKKN